MCPGLSTSGLPNFGLQVKNNRICRRWPPGQPDGDKKGKIILKGGREFAEQAMECVVASHRGLQHASGVEDSIKILENVIAEQAE